MADERYHRLLGIEPAGEIPTHYELLVIARDVTDPQVIEAAYKEQMKKLQQIRSSKDKGFIEYLKEELRTARLTLTNADKRRAYDESLVEDASKGFRDWVKPMMALGSVPRGVYDTLVAKGVSDGLTLEQAAQVIREVAAESGATLQLDDGSGTGSDVGDEGGDGEEPSFTDDLDPGSEPPAPVVTRAPSPPPRMSEQPAKLARGRGFYGEGESPWARGGRTGGPASSSPVGRSPAASGSNRGAPLSTSASGRRPSELGRVESAGTQRERWRSQNDQSAVSEAARQFNLGAKLAKVAGEVHHQLQFYFPPANGRSTITYQRGGVSYEKVFETEQKTYRDSLQKFQSALERLGDLSGPEADDLRAQANQRITMIKGILDEIRQHKLRQLAGLSKAEELRMWQVFVGSQRSTRLGQTVGEG